MACSFWGKPAALLWAVPQGTELMSPASSQWGPEVHQQPREWAWKQIFPQSLLTVVLADTLATALWEALRQWPPATVCPECSPTGTAGQPMFLVLNCKIGGNCYAASEYLILQRNEISHVFGNCAWKRCWHLYHLLYPREWVHFYQESCHLPQSKTS